MIANGKHANLKPQKTKDLNIRDVDLQGLNITFFVFNSIIIGISWWLATTYFLETAL
jgi:hypothetical protein